MGRKRKSGKRGTFDPHKGSEKQITDRILGDYKRIYDSAVKDIHDIGLQHFRKRLEAREDANLGVTIVLALADACDDTAGGLRRVVAKWNVLEEKEKNRQAEEYAREQEIEEASRSAADAAFPGVEDDGGK